MDIKRATELYIADRIKEQFSSDIPVVPFHGGDENADAIDIEPPFVVVHVNTAEKRFQMEDTYQAVGSIQIVCHITESSSQEYADLVSDIHHAFMKICPGATDTFRLHGVDITNHRSASDEDAQAYADLLDFQAGVGGG